MIDDIREKAEEWCRTHDAANCVDVWLAGYQAAQPRWISVNERLPETGKKVLWQGVGDNYQFVGSLIEKMKSYCCIAVVPGLLHGLPEVTHWMPLPPAPEREE